MMASVLAVPDDEAGCPGSAAHAPPTDTAGVAIFVVAATPQSELFESGVFVFPNVAVLGQPNREATECPPSLDMAGGKPPARIRRYG